MDKSKKRFTFISGLISIVLALLFLILLVYVIYLLFTEIDKEITVSLIVAFLTAIIAVLINTIGKRQEKKMKIDFELRVKKEPTYEKIINFFLRLFMAENPNLKGIIEKPSEEEMFDFIYKTTDQLILWGSDDVIKAWITLREALVKQQSKKLSKKEIKNNMFLLENLFYEIRKDLGYKNKDLEKGDLLRFFINDIDKNL